MPEQEITRIRLRVNEQLAEKKLEDLQEEYYKLFTDPFGDDQLNLYASHYSDGRNYGETLVAVRQLFMDSGIAKEDDVTEPEDSLPVMIDLLATLIDLEKKGTDTESHQQALVNSYLIPLVKEVKKEVEKSDGTDFYRAAIDFVYAYLDLEKGLSDSFQ